MNETNEPETPETFAAVVARIDDYLKDFRFRPQANPDTPLRRLVAAHEREVAELKHLNIEHCKDAKLAADEMQKKDATIAELKAMLQMCRGEMCCHCNCANECDGSCEVLRKIDATLKEER